GMSADIVFDRGSPSDIDEIKTFTSNTWKVGYYTDLYSKLADTGTMDDYVDKVIERWVNDGSVYVLRVSGRPVATIHMEKLPDGSVMLGGLRVHPEYRGSRLGMSIMQETIQFLRGKTERLRSAVYSWNEPSLRLVHRLGFHQVEEYPIYTFQGGSTAVPALKPVNERYAGRWRCFFIDWKYMCSDDPDIIHEEYSNNLIVDGSTFVYFDIYEGGIDLFVNDSDDASSFIEKYRSMNGRITFYVRKALANGLPYVPASSLTVWEYRY
uniref:Putative acetyltransferase Ta0821 n=1 Tax=Thermoplasma acidophilum (strain ATCC 25905 / DSM 1728 / JCM 9062 / NBRC 15155 / AMRC-C165) TaxID=273075 RepID=UPI000181D27F